MHVLTTCRTHNSILVCTYCNQIQFIHVTLYSLYNVLRDSFTKGTRTLIVLLFTVRMCWEFPDLCVCACVNSIIHIMHGLWLLSEYGYKVYWNCTVPCMRYTQWGSTWCSQTWTFGIDRFYGQSSCRQFNWGYAICQFNWDYVSSRVRQLYSFCSSRQFVFVAKDNLKILAQITGNYYFSPLFNSWIVCKNARSQ